jgi:hypothetical protein
MVSYKEFEEKLQELRYGRTRISFFLLGLTDGVVEIVKGIAKRVGNFVRSVWIPRPKNSNQLM